MTPPNDGYLILAVLVIMAVLLTIDVFIKRIMAVGCLILFIAIILAAFVYTLNH